MASPLERPRLTKVERFEQVIAELDRLTATPEDVSQSSTADAPIRDEARMAACVRELKGLCIGGIPDTPAHIRPRAYRLLLELPSSASMTLQYNAFVAEVGARIQGLPEPKLEDGVEYQELREDKLLREIQRDVERTFGGLAWFGASVDEVAEPAETDVLWARIRMLDQLDADKAQKLREDTAAAPAETVVPSSTASDSPSGPKSPPLTLSLDSLAPAAIVVTPATPTTPTSPSFPLPASSHLPQPSTRREALLRPLFIHAMLNPGVAYVQGMNFLVGVAWWIHGCTGGADAEAAAFFTLGAILAQFRDLYVQALDGSISPATSPSSSRRRPAPYQAPTGLAATMDRFNSLLTWLDPHLAASLAGKRVDPAHYLIRWITTCFAMEFNFYDLLRIWDRIFAFYPSTLASAAGPPEILSPVLSHLLDMSLAMVLMERPALISPNADFSRCIKILQDPQIEGAGVDRLLGISYEIRARRLGFPRKQMERPKVPEQQTSPQGGTWRSATIKWTSKAKGAALAASTGPTANSLRSYWNPAADDTDEGTDVKALPPPPSAHNDDEDDDKESLSGSDSDMDADGAPSLATRAAASWGTWRDKFASSDTAAALSKRATNARAAAAVSAASLAHLGSSDAAAELAKRTTNLTIQAQMLRDSLAETTPQRLARIKENVAAASGRFMASTGSETAGPPRPGSPILQPFTPPGRRVSGGEDSPGLGRRAISPAPSTFGPPGEGSLSPEFKPLWLSGSARRAGSGEHEAIMQSPAAAAAGASKRLSGTFNPLGSPSMSRSSTTTSTAGVAAEEVVRSRSPTPSTSAPIVRSESVTESFHTPDDSPAESGDEAEPKITTTTVPTVAVSEKPRSSSKNSTMMRSTEPISTAFEIPTDGTEPSMTPTALSSISATPSTTGRGGWNLTDGPVVRSRPTSTISVDSTQHASQGDAQSENGGGAEAEKRGPQRSRVSSSRRQAPSVRKRASVQAAPQGSGGEEDSILDSYA